MAAWAAPADIINQYDARTLGALVMDDGTRGSAGELASDPVLANALTIASGRAEAALLQGGRYAIADLQALGSNATNGTPALNTANSLAYFKYLVCCIAFDILWERRPYNEKRAEATERAEDALALLRSGKDILNLPAPIAAGEASICTPSIQSYEGLRTIVGRARGHFYPHKVMPRAGGGY